MATRVQILFAFHLVGVRRDRLMPSEKSIHLSLLITSYNLIVRLTGLFSHTMTTSLEEGKLWIQISCTLLKNWFCIASCIWWRFHQIRTHFSTTLWHSVNLNLIAKSNSRLIFLAFYHNVFSGFIFQLLNYLNLYYKGLNF